MRPVSRPLHAFAALVAVTALVTGCSAGAASPTPASSPTGGSSHTLASSPRASASAFPSPAAASAPPSGTPIPSPMPTQRTIESPDPSFSDVAVTCVDHLTGCSLHRRNPAGVEAPGFPMELEGTLVDNTWNDFTVGCGSPRGPLVRDGYDDVTFVGLVGPSGNAEIHGFHSSGYPARGWPQPFPAPNGECHGFMLDPTGEHLIAWGYEGVEQDIELVADRTEFTMFDLRGRTVPGWPRGSDGAASGPVPLADGIAYVSGTRRAWAHDAGGEVRPGWGYRLAAKVAPVAFGDRMAVTQPSGASDDAVVVLGLDGQPLPGFPAALDGPIETLCLYGDTPCLGDVRPDLGPDGTVYVALGNGTTEVAEDDPAGGRIEAIGPNGRVVDGWPVQLPDWSHATRVGWSSEGGVIATVVVCAPVGCYEVAHREARWYGLDGDLVDVIPLEGDTLD